jgi:hypothetical protein
MFVENQKLNKCNGLRFFEFQTSVKASLIIFEVYNQVLIL